MVGGARQVSGSPTASYFVRRLQLLNLSSLGSAAGITHNTARSWLGVLEARGAVAVGVSPICSIRNRIASIGSGGSMGWCFVSYASKAALGGAVLLGVC